ncbi:MAG: serine/threonine protein kinase [Chloroflexi bacterium]|nr:serine/threonine protein kinase [Chloroflexota bacterium]
MHPSSAPLREPPAWLLEEPYDEVSLGTLKSGKEAEVFLLERRYADGSTVLLAHKRYRPRRPSPGELRELGFNKATLYRHDSTYRAGWFLSSRDRRAVAHKTDHGHEVIERLWPIQEMEMLERAWASGASVPYPVERTEDGVVMEFIGDADSAAPRLAQAQLSATELASAWEQLIENLRRLTAAGVVHADLSAYNALWWQDRLVIIDLPQAVEFTTNTDAPDLLHRDLANVAAWFERRGIAVDVEDVYGDLLGLAW